MVQDVLAPIFESGLSKVMKLRYVAYGNVRGAPGDRAGISCQHGAVECLHNRYINCAQSANPAQDAWFPYVQCLARDLTDVAQRREGCAADAGFDAAALRACAEGEAGAELERAAYRETAALRPAHMFVPWVVVEGVALGGDFENLDRYLCAAAAPVARCVMQFVLQQRVFFLLWGAPADSAALGVLQA
jgi:interferon gamma-inducible protein 30